MNFKLVFKVSGRVLIVLALTMLLPLLVTLIYHESPIPFLVSIAITIAVGFFLSLFSASEHFYAREGFFTVGLIWIMIGIFGALPFYFSGYFPSWVDCMFESFSGFTTTGATILADIEALPKGILFWRSFTHWLGGVGVLALSSALLPALGAHGQYLTQAETPGPVYSKIVPKQAHATKITYTIYCSLTILEILALLIAKMPLYDAFIHTFSTAGTGGFSSKNLSVGSYASPAIDMIIAIFIIMFSVNFAIYFLLVTRRLKDVLKSDELRFFLTVVFLATFVVSINIHPIYQSVGESFRYGFFQVVSIISTTGFSTADFIQWPQFSQMVLVLLMICGACAGSTGGGMKCSRILLLLRCIRREIHHIIHPRAVSVVKLDGKVVDEDDLRSVLIFSSAYFLITLLAALVLSLDNFSFPTSFTAALTCMSNTGPGLDLVGPCGNFLGFSALSKIVMSLCMVIGRLEILPILVLFSRNAWKKA